MAKKLTITVSDDVYDGLYRHVGARRIGRYLEDLARPFVVVPDLEAAYRQQAADEARDKDAMEWCESGLNETLPDDDFADFTR